MYLVYKSYNLLSSSVWKKYKYTSSKLLNYYLKKNKKNKNGNETDLYVWYELRDKNAITTITNENDVMYCIPACQVPSLRKTSGILNTD